MKTCELCGASSPDDAATCHACGEGTFASNLTYQFAAAVAPVMVSGEPSVAAEPTGMASYQLKRQSKGKRP